MWIFNEEDTGKMNAEIFSALAQLEKERGIPQAYMIDKISQALVAAYKKDKEGYTDNVFVDVSDGDMKLYVQKEVVDDVISTGESLHALEELVEKAGGTVAGRMAVLAEGDAQNRKDIVYLGKLPVFNPDGTVKG